MTPPRPAPADGQAGFTIIETMIASVLLLVGLVATLTIVEQAASVTVTTKTREQATSLQREVVEGARSVLYDQLTPAGAAPAIRMRPALADASGGSGWTIARRDATYKVAVGVCVVDDPRDGLGVQEAGVFCAAGSPTPTDVNDDGTLEGIASASGAPCTGTCDSTPADYKRLISLVTWRNGGRNVQAAQINSPGLSAAPAVTSLTAAPTITDPAAGSLPVNVTTSGSPESISPAIVELYVDGKSIGSATGVGKAWASSWVLGPVTTTTGAQPVAGEVLDGSYELSAKAFDKYGQYGVTRTQVIVVNRRLAFAPERVEAGRNGLGVEIEWSEAKERDSAGFRVDRTVDGGGTWTTACARAQQTACRDGLAPPALAGITLQYRVVPFDRAPDNSPREGDRSEIVAIANPAPPAPGTPGTFSATLAAPNTVLTWTPPAVGSPPDHYNIYRDGQGYANRLTSAYVAPGDPLTFTDATTTGQQHDYWITAVNAQLGESAKLGPVTR